MKRMEGTGGGIMHNKYCIIDNRVLITGSYNWSAAAEYSNDENALFLEGAPIIQDYAADFERLWQSP